MNTENMLDEELIAKFKAKVGTGKSTETPADTRYQYPYVELENVMENPTEYIIPQCLPACKALWSKNIETFMVSNNDDDDLYVLLTGVSPENMAIFQKLQKQDPRFIFDSYRNTIGIAVKGHDEQSQAELEALTDVFNIQDTMRFKTVTDFVESYKYTGGEMVIEDDGTIRREINPALANISISEAIQKSGKEDLYVASEGRVYDSPLYLKWHKRYQASLHDDLKDTISMYASNRDNYSDEAARLRDTYLGAEREYVTELLKDESMQELIGQVNQMPSDILFESAKKMVDAVELGTVPEDQMGIVEKRLIVMLAAIQDRVLLKDLVLRPDGNSKTR